MFVRRLLVSAVLACLAACTTTANSPVNKNPDLKQSTSIGNTKALDYQMIPKRSEQPHSVTVSNHNALDTALCLKQRLGSDFKMPEEFIGHTVYTDHNHSVGLVNPFTKTEGITMDVVAQGANSEIRLYSNGNLLSRAWQQLPNKCGQGKTTVITQNSAKSVAASKAASSRANTGNTDNRIDFVAKSKTEPSLWVDNTNSAQSMSKPAVVATMASNTPITVTPPAIVATEAVNTPTSIVSTTNTADQGWLTEEDMNIIAPATAAVVTPLMAKAAYDSVKQPSSNGQSLVATNTTTVKANNVAPVRSVAKTTNKATVNSTSNAVKTTASPTTSSKTATSNSKKAATSTSNKASSTKTTSNTQQAANKSKAQEKENTRNNKSSSKNKNAASTKANNSAEQTNKNSKTKARNTSNVTIKNEAANNKNSKTKAKAEATNSKNSKVKTKAETTNNKNSKTTNKQDKAATQKANQTSKSSKKETTGVKNDKTKTKVQEGNNKTKTTTNKEKTSNKKAENSKKPANTNKSKPKT